LADFDAIAEEVRPEELQQIFRLLVCKVEWGNNGSHHLHFYSMPKTKKSASPEQTGDADRFDITRWTGCPWDSYVEPYCLIVPVIKDTLMQLRESLFQSAIA
jgi:hypothetical protein